MRTCYAHACARSTVLSIRKDLHLRRPEPLSLQPSAFVCFATDGWWDWLVSNQLPLVFQTNALPFELQALEQKVKESDPEVLPSPGVQAQFATMALPSKEECAGFGLATV